MTGGGTGGGGAQTCAPTCPAGYNCSVGVCLGGNSSSLVFNVPVPPQHLVSGIITRNGATPPVPGCYSGYTRALIDFVHLTDTRFNTSLAVGNCTNPGDTFAFSGNLYPGSYRVTIRQGTFGSSSGLPSWSTVASSNFTVTGPNSSVVFDVLVPPQHLVSGIITRNGATPTVPGCYSGYTRALIDFVHLTDTRFSTSLTVGNCTNPSDTFAFSGNLYPGSYRVTVRQGTFGTSSGLPSWDTVSNSNFTVTGPMSTVVFDVPVPPQHLVSGIITRNGATPTVPGCYSGYTRALIDFVHLTDPRFNTSLTVGNCTNPSDTFAFSGNLYPGSYRVTVRQGTFGSSSGLPSWSTVSSSNFTVTGPNGSVVFDVPVPPQHVISGVITRNGARPTVPGCFSGYTRALIDFVHLSDTRFNTSITVGNCTSPSDTFAFTGSLYPGSYRVTVRQGTFGTSSGLPSWDTVSNSNFTVSGPNSSVVFDVPVPPQHLVSGIVTRNGSTPPVPGCYSGYTRALIDFVHLTDTRFNTSMAVGNCTNPSDTFAFSGDLYPGSYRVTVRQGTFGSSSGLPSWSTVSNSNFTVTGPSSAAVFDVPVPAQITVSGIITRNGANPTVPGCYSGYTRAVLDFDHLTDSRFSASMTVGNCTNPSETFAFSGSLYPGNYRVTVRAGTFGSSSGLPSWDTVVVNNLAVP